MDKHIYPLYVRVSEFARYPQFPEPSTYLYTPRARAFVQLKNKIVFEIHLARNFAFSFTINLHTVKC